MNRYVECMEFKNGKICQSELIGVRVGLRPGSVVSTWVFNIPTGEVVKVLNGRVMGSC